MGADMVTMTLTLPSGTQPDWGAAARAIRGVPLANLWDTGDEIYPWEEWLESVENLPSAESAFVALRAAQGVIHRCCSELRGALEHGSDDLVAGSSPSHRFWVAGGPSWGEYPGELVEPAIFAAESGVLTIAGFDHFTQHAAVPIKRRELDFDKVDLRLVKFGVVLAHAAEQALANPPAFSEPTLLDWYETWISDLQTAEDSGDALGGLFRFISQGLQVTAWLKRPRAKLTAAALDACAREFAADADDAGEASGPVRRSAVAAARAARSSTTEYWHMVEAVSDPALRDEPELAHYLKRIYGGTLASALATEIAVETMIDAISALADLCGETTHTLIQRPPTPIASQKPRKAPRAARPLDQYLSLVLVGDGNWQAGEHAIADLDTEDRGGREQDLAELREMVTEDRYRRFDTSGAVGSERLVIAAPYAADGSDLAGAIGRLARTGVLEAIGASWWSAPAAPR